MRPCPCWIVGTESIQGQSQVFWRLFVLCRKFFALLMGARTVLDLVRVTRLDSMATAKSYRLMEALIQQCWIDSYLQHLGLNDSLALQSERVQHEQTLDDYAKLGADFPSSVTESKFLPLQKAYDRNRKGKSLNRFLLVPQCQFSRHCLVCNGNKRILLLRQHMITSSQCRCLVFRWSRCR